VDFDDLVIGSGLAALGTVLGLLAKTNAKPATKRRVGVLCSPSGTSTGQFSYYDARRTVPCAYLGMGGLGNYWHGVIPMGWRHNFGQASDTAFATLFQHFYPHTDVSNYLGKHTLFVPWRAIRPATLLQRLSAAQPQQLTLLNEAAVSLRFEAQGNTVVVSSNGTNHRAARTWVAAGALHTPALLAQTWGAGVQRGLASDHVFCYVGQVQNQPNSPPKRVTYSRDGAFFPATYDAANTALYTLRPAAFAFKQLDFGIEQRAVFGLPTGNAVAKIARRMSPGLLVEAFYNRFGLFGGTQTHSVYAQIPVENAYELIDLQQHQNSQPKSALITPLRPQTERIRQATDAARAAQPYPALRHSCRPDIHLPGIHLHHTLNLMELSRLGINTANSLIQVIDASALRYIGPDHHSFKMMLAAYQRAELMAW
jgi:hypothetical protein